MKLHDTTFGYLMPTDDQKETMNKAREATKRYADELESLIPDGPDKTFIIRNVRQNGMWINVAITRHADGTPRS